MRVLFVDDEPQVLKGITRMLDCADVDWNVSTANSALEALEVFEQEPVDILITDMKMPGMDGAELLDEISRRYPETVRIILSGQASKESVCRAVTPMHQYLSKPCDSEVIRTTVARACALRELLESTRSHEFLGRISSLPSLPTLYQEVVAEIESEHGTVARVGELVGQDPAMTAKLLQLVNSAIFGLRSVVTSPAQSASLIGMNTLKSLVLSLQVFKAFESKGVPGFSIDKLLTHSLRVGSISQLIAKSEGLGKELANESFTAGLLHDVGKLILAANAPEDFGSALTKSKVHNIPLVEAEQTVFGIGHDRIGGYLLALWGIPQSIVEAVTFHHSPGQCDKALSSMSLVYVANYLAHEENGTVTDEQHGQCQELLAHLGTLERIDTWRRNIQIDEE